MGLRQFLVSFFVLLLSGTEVTGTLKSTLDPSLKICISLGIGWGGWAVFDGLVNEVSQHP